MFNFLNKNNSINTILHSRPFNENFYLILTCGVYLLIWFSILSYKFYHFGYYDWDLALYSQAMWKLTQGSFYSDLWGMNFLANHAEYIAFLILPIYKAFSHPLTLVFLKILSTTAGGYVLFLIAREAFSFRKSLIIMLLYLFYPANIFALLYEFHFESLSVGFIFLLFYFHQHKRYTPFMITVVLTALIKENLPLIIIMFGLYGLITKPKLEDKIKWGVWPVAIGIIIFSVAIFIITPYLRRDFPTSNQYIGLYSNLGDTPINILKTLLFNPVKTFKLIFMGANIQLFKELFAPLLFLPFFTPHILVLSLPIFLQHLLSSTYTEHVIYFHYTATLAPFIFLAGLETLNSLQFKISKKLFNKIFFLLIFTSLINLTQYKNQLTHRIILTSHEESIKLWRIIDQIPQDKGVIATLKFLSPLAHHQTVRSFLDVLNQTYGLSSKKFELSDDIVYALISYDDLWVNSRVTRDPKNSQERINKFCEDGWVIKEEFDKGVLLERPRPIHKNK